MRRISKTKAKKCLVPLFETITDYHLIMIRNREMAVLMSINHFASLNSSFDGMVNIHELRQRLDDFCDPLLRPLIVRSGRVDVGVIMGYKRYMIAKLGLRVVSEG
ncbi:MAG: hypothetical protein ACOZBH_01085 [Patescibacteria group bacterium]